MNYRVYNIQPLGDDWSAIYAYDFLVTNLRNKHVKEGGGILTIHKRINLYPEPRKILFHPCFPCVS